MVLLIYTPIGILTYSDFKKGISMRLGGGGETVHNTAAELPCLDLTAELFGRGLGADGKNNEENHFAGNLIRRFTC